MGENEKDNEDSAKITDPVQDVGSDKAVGSNIKNANNNINIEDSNSLDPSRHKVADLSSEDLNGLEEAYLWDPIPELIPDPEEPRQLIPDPEEPRPIKSIPLPTDSDPVARSRVPQPHAANPNLAVRGADLHSVRIDKKEPIARSIIPQPHNSDLEPRSQDPKLILDPEEPRPIKSIPLPTDSNPTARSRVPQPHAANPNLAAKGGALNPARAKISQIHKNPDHMPRSQVPTPYSSGTASSKATDRGAAIASRLPVGNVPVKVVNKLKDLRKRESVRLKDKATSSDKVAGSDKATSSDSTAKSNLSSSSANFSSTAKKPDAEVKVNQTANERTILNDAANKQPAAKGNPKAVHQLAVNHADKKHSAKPNSMAYKPTLKKPAAKVNPAVQQTAVNHETNKSAVKINLTNLKPVATAACKPTLKKQPVSKNTVPVIPSAPVIRGTRSYVLRKKATEEKINRELKKK